MKKYLPNISVFFVIFTLTLLISGSLFPQKVLANHTGPCAPGEQHFLLGCRVPSSLDRMVSGVVDSVVGFAVDVLLAPLGWVAILILQLANLVLWLSGQLLDLVIEFTVIDMRDNISQATTINDAWSIIRDLANMFFIFILLYVALRTILGYGDDTKKLVINVIVVALLINFSLFFTKLVIDASNILAITFYDAMTVNADGISDRMMAQLELSSLMDTNAIGAFDGKKLIIVGLLGTAVVMLAAFIFFAMAMMLVVRFVILMFVLIFSPIAFMAFVLPGLKKYGDQWREALIGQAFFAPIFLLLVWVVISVSNGLFGGNTPASFPEAFVGVPRDPTIGGDRNNQVVAGNAAIVMNFMIIAALLVASLIISKSWANRAGSGVAKVTKWASGAAGKAAFGGVAAIGRNVIGSRAATMAESEELKKKAAEGSIRARLQLAAANKVSRSSFDVRGTGMGGVLDAGKVGKAQQKGFVGVQEERAKTYEKYKPSPEVVTSAKADEVRARKNLEKARGASRKEVDKLIPKSPDLVKAEKELKEAEETTRSVTQKFGGPETLENLDRNIQSAETMAGNVTMSAEARQLASERGVQLKNQAKSIRDAQERNKQAQEQVSRLKEQEEHMRNRIVKDETENERLILAQAIRRKKEVVGRMERMAKRIEKQNILGISGIITSGKTRAAAVRAAAKGKSKKERALEAVKDWREEEVGEKEAPETETPTTNEANKGEESKTA